MPTRTIRLTGRKRILREHARITIQEDTNSLAFDAELRLSEYGLPGDAHVFVEAYRQTQYMRFDFGLIQDLRAPDDRHLSDFGSPDGVLFRVKVVTATDPHGLLLAEADQIRPRQSTDEEDTRTSLLPVVADDALGDEVWRLEFDDQQTLLKINAALGNVKALARDPAFYSLVYPAVLRTVLSHVLLRERHHDTEDTGDWRSCWLRFAASLPGVGKPPAEDDESAIDEWIYDAVSRFCTVHRIRPTFEDFWQGEKE